MKFVQGRFIQRIKRTQSIESFRFQLQERLDFIPGQFIQVLFDKEEPGNKDLNKYLSFSSSPGKEYIEVTKRLSQSSFSEKLRNLKPGDSLMFKGPLGRCVIKPEYKKIGFLIGGIGITPVISILEEISLAAKDTDAVLIYSNRSEQDVPFKEDLDKWNQQPGVRIVYTMTDVLPENKGYIYGRIDKSIVQEQMPDIKQRVVFLFGPPGMVKAMHEVCLQIGVNEDNLRIENFIGYS
jgi:glycine betaine catabolism B